MKTLAIIGFCYGERYQQFLPFYAYSALRAYPDYTVILFVDRPLLPGIRASLSHLSRLGDVVVHSSYDFGLHGRQPVSPAAFRGLRWLFFDEAFSQFQAVYSGDIDVFFAREDGGIFEPHMAHARALGLPYSNYVRLTTDSTSISVRQGMMAVYQRQWRTVVKRLRGSPVMRDRLSGLHFMVTADYFDRVRPYFDEYIDGLSDPASEFTSMTDEEILHHLMRQSGVGLPPVSPNSPEMDNRNFHSIAYRPHHGIHLGIFRDRDTVARSRQVLQSYVYREYYEQYLRWRDEDPVFRELLQSAGPYVVRLLSALDSYIGRLEISRA